MNKKILFYNFGFILGIILFANLISFASADECRIPSVEKGVCTQLTQTCSNCTYVNITQFQYPNKTITTLNIPMSKTTPVDYNYTTCDTNNLGTYAYTAFGDPDGYLSNPQTCYYDVTPTGFMTTTAQGIIYLVFLIAMLFIFLLTLYGAIKIKWSHKRDGDMRVVEVSKIRYLKPALMVFAYIELMWMFGILYSITFNNLQYDSISAFFYWAYSIMLYLLIPIAFVTLLFILIGLAEDRKLRKKILRGYNR